MTIDSLTLYADVQKAVILPRIVAHPFVQQRLIGDGHTKPPLLLLPLGVLVLGLHREPHLHRCRLCPLVLTVLPRLEVQPIPVREGVVEPSVAE